MLFWMVLWWINISKRGEEEFLKDLEINGLDIIDVFNEMVNIQSKEGI